MSRTDPRNPFNPNNLFAGGNSERNWLTRVHRDTSRPDQENTHPPALDVIRRQVTGECRLKQFTHIAGKVMQEAFDLYMLNHIPLADYILLYDWLYPNGKELDVDRALCLSWCKERYDQQPQQCVLQNMEEGKNHFLKLFTESLSLFGENDDGGEEDEHNNKKINDKKNEKLLEAYAYGKQTGEQEEYYRERYSRYENGLENDQNKDPLG